MDRKIACTFLWWYMIIISIPLPNVKLWVCEEEKKSHNNWGETNEKRNQTPFGWTTNACIQSTKGTVAYAIVTLLWEQQRSDSLFFVSSFVVFWPVLILLYSLLFSLQILSFTPFFGRSTALATEFWRCVAFRCITILFFSRSLSFFCSGTFFALVPWLTRLSYIYILIWCSHTLFSPWLVC